MIVFYDNQTGRIYGTVGGRVHTKEELNTTVHPKGVDPKRISKKVFSLEETKEIESSSVRVIEKKVVLKNGEFSGFASADPVEPDRPDAVETILVDLTRPLQEIKSDFSKVTRQSIKKAEGMNFREIGFEERSLVLEVLDEIESMKNIKLAKHILRVRAPFLDGLRRMYVVEDGEKQPLAAAVITCFGGGKFIYSLGGVTKKGKNNYAGDFLIWELIKDAKNLGYKVFDFGGIYAEWASEEKKKVNEFKERWGGKRAPLGNARK